jgi:hypothetical protein
MWRITYLLPFTILALSSCVSGAPTLSDDQEHKLSVITVYPHGQLPNRPYTVLAAIKWRGLLGCSVAWQGIWQC